MNNLIQKFYGPMMVMTLSTLLSSFLSANEAILVGALDSGSHYTCGIKTDNSIVCWGQNHYGQATPPSGTFLQVSAGKRHSCGVQTDQTVACWGYNGDGEATPPSGTFFQVSVGWEHTCSIRTDNTVECWGKNDYDQATPPKGTFIKISTGYEHTCGIRTDNTVECWGRKGNPWNDGPKSNIGDQIIPPSNTTFSQISAGGWHTCGIRANDNTVVCWGHNGDGQASPPEGTFSQISTGIYYTCGVKTDNTVACWGWNEMGQAQPPNSTCTSRNEKYPKDVCSSPLNVNLSYVSAGKGGEKDVHTCGLRTDNTVICWGYNEYGQATPPPCLIVKSPEPHSATFLPYAILYGVHKDGKKDSQFFTIDTRTFVPNVLGPVYENYNIAALAIHPLTRQLFAVSGDQINKKGYFYQQVAHKRDLLEIGGTSFREVEGISIHSDGTFWGWAADAGLFKIETDENNEPYLRTLDLVLPSNGEVEIEDITWNQAGTLLYAIANLTDEESLPDSFDENRPKSAITGARLWAYHISDGAISTVCDKRMSSLGEEIEALGTLPNDNDTLLFHFSGHDNLTFGVLDVQTCQIVRKEIPTNYYVEERGDPPVYKGRVRSYNNVRSFAWLSCMP
ncbi:MAG: hypothetical protein DRR16_11345 [Candidatus Parabeggiatoa sp. nov. 3]|nr:MAG: hypothetical protein DRR00_16865 [Gammaproteobacteria bacterium]RKZ51219.1 MAG: hypothetical protein DRQ99_33330 [Gammaproteobacteria bacterium]RKZ85759.1 MAG: hypothetical protein DRR16_11345 [Gammaproteobacteria bacterium]